MGGVHILRTGHHQTKEVKLHWFPLPKPPFKAISKTGNVKTALWLYFHCQGKLYCISCQEMQLWIPIGNLDLSKSVILTSQGEVANRPGEPIFNQNPSQPRDVGLAWPWPDLVLVQWLWDWADGLDLEYPMLSTSLYFFRLFYHLILGSTAVVLIGLVVPAKLRTTCTTVLCQHVKILPIPNPLQSVYLWLWVVLTSGEPKLFNLTLLSELIDSTRRYTTSLLPDEI